MTTGTTIANNGAGNLTLRADASGIDNGGSVANNGTVDWSKSTGIVSALYDMNGSFSPGTLVSNATWQAPLYSGIVTQITGYQLVNSVTDLQNIGNNLAGNYALGKDLDAGNSAFQTLGFAAGIPFTGQFDGMWHTISNLLPSFDAVFGDIGPSGVVRDVNVNANVGQVDFFFDNGTAILAIQNHGTIANVFTSGVIASRNLGNEYAGLVATNFGLIARSGSSAAVTADGNVGGLVIGNEGTITESYATGPVLGLTSHGPAGGLVGQRRNDHTVLRVGPRDGCIASDRRYLRQQLRWSWERRLLERPDDGPTVERRQSAGVERAHYRPDERPDKFCRVGLRS